MDIARKLVAEFLGTGWLVLGGCGSAVLAAAVPNLGIGYEGVALAFGLTVVTGAYAFGHVSGAHFNPAISLGLCTARRLPVRDLIPYWIAQVAGGIVGAAFSTPSRAAPRASTPRMALRATAMANTRRRAIRCSPVSSARP